MHLSCWQKLNAWFRAQRDNVQHNVEIPDKNEQIDFDIFDSAEVLNQQQVDEIEQDQVHPRFSINNAYVDIEASNIIDQRLRR